MIIKNIFLILLLPIIFAFSSCKAPSSPIDQVSKVEHAKPPPSEKKAAVHDPVTEGWLHGASANAWRDLTQGGRYRWAGPEDFRFPDWAKQRYSSDLERAAKSPIQEGHIKHDYGSNEAALIIVDTSIADWNRYSIIIFSEPGQESAGGEVTWLFRDRDLSRVQLGWSNGDTLGISEYQEDGSYRHCFVQWNKKRRAYSCDLKKIE